MIAALDLYLAAAPAGALAAYATLAALGIGLLPFAAVDLIEHVAAARRASQAEITR